MNFQPQKHVDLTKKLFHLSWKCSLDNWWQPWKMLFFWFDERCFYTLAAAISCLHFCIKRLLFTNLRTQFLDICSCSRQVSTCQASLTLPILMFCYSIWVSNKRGWFCQAIPSNFIFKSFFVFKNLFVCLFQYNLKDALLCTLIFLIPPITFFKGFRPSFRHV